MAMLYVICGAPGCGKSTWADQWVHENDNAVWVSRDEERFALLKEGESYFSHEDEVTENFWNKINKNLAAGRDVIADQTSLNARSRLWLLDHISVPCVKIAVYMDTPLSICLERNSGREGKKRVPDDRLKGMFNSFTVPSIREGFDRVWELSHTNYELKEIEAGDEE